MHENAAGFQQKMPSPSRAIFNFSRAAIFRQWRYLLPEFAAQQPLTNQGPLILLPGIIQIAAS